MIQRTNQAALADPDLEFDGEGLAILGIQSVPSLPLPEANLDSWSYRYVKRFMDFTLSCMILVAFAIPGLLIAALIRLTSAGPVFYCEQRIGRFGQPFRIWKFRTMYADAAHRAHIADAPSGVIALEWRMRKDGRDPRITPIGRLLRKWSLDEIPQLINVFRGEMSLIGPRPIVQSEARLYGDLFRFYLEALPGLSGLWQVSGRSGIGYKRRAELDATYVLSWNLASDISILFRTFGAVLGRSGAH